jgi:hypothetical protein
MRVDIELWSEVDQSRGTRKGYQLARWYRAAWPGPSFIPNKIFRIRINSQPKYEGVFGLALRPEAPRNTSHQAQPGGSRGGGRYIKRGGGAQQAAVAESRKRARGRYTGGRYRAMP